MTAPAVLVLAPNPAARQAIASTLDGLQLTCTLSSSLDHAVECARAGTLDAIIADWKLLARVDRNPRSPLTLATRLSTSIAQLRAVHAGQQPFATVRAAAPLRIIITTDDENPEAPAAAIPAGADAYLRADEARLETVLGSYLTRFLQLQAMLQRAAEMVGQSAAAMPPSAAPPSVAPDAVPATTAHVTDAFALRDEDLRAPDSGRWDAKRIADALAITLKDLTDAVEVNYSTAARTPDSEALQEKLAPFANVIAMTRQIYEQDDARLRKWLQHPQSALGNSTPLKALLKPGQAAAVEQWVAGAWLGESA